MTFDFPHRRLNCLTGEWVLVSPQRGQRPWLGQVEKRSQESLPTYDPGCYLCPGNTRNTGLKNPAYTRTYVFENDFSALLPPAARNLVTDSQNELFTAQPEAGICRVVCFSPRHDLSLPELSQVEVEAVIRTWIDQTIELIGYPFINYIQLFENKGAMMGASNPHPHSQVWASTHIPNEPAKELVRQEYYANVHQACLLCDYLAAENEIQERIVIENEWFTVLVPYWAIWPFEVLLISKRHQASLPELNPNEVSALADILRQLTSKYDNLFEISFPYSMGFHQAPCDEREHSSWHLHAHFYPPLLRSATVRKFMVGYELLGMPQRDLTPETAAEKLRGLSVIHYKKLPPP
jgi:UDPglucose--hexose-1-phosphate uridylyltransferase